MFSLLHDLHPYVKVHFQNCKLLNFLKAAKKLRIIGLVSEESIRREEESRERERNSRKRKAEDEGNGGRAGPAPSTSSAASSSCGGVQVRC